MSKDSGKTPFEEIQEQLQQALKSGNISFAGAFPGAPGPSPASDDEAPEPPADPDETLERIRAFNFKPREIRDHLNRFVIQQQEAKKVLSVAICDHYNHVRQCLADPKAAEQEYHKQNILLLGPTGVGKTYLMRHIARLIGVPFVKADATKFSETGYVGSDVEDLVRDLYKVSGQNAELAQYGIIYIDEIDKIAAARNASGAKDVSGRGVQINLLKLMEDTEVSLFSPTDMMGQMQAMMSASRGGKERPRTLSTRHILFIVSGAFDQLAESVKKRMDATPIGFGANLETPERIASEFLHHVETQDLIKYGFEPEFIGRLPVRVACDPLTQRDLHAILTSSEGSLLEQYRHDFRGYGMDFTITTEALQAIAAKAHAEGTGARGLMTVFEQVFRYFKFELPSTGVESFEVTAETISDPPGALKKLLREHLHLQRSVLRKELDAFAARFQETHALELVFNDEAADVLMDAAVDQDKTIRALCEERFKDFEHGLQIVTRNTGQQRFEVSGAMAANPDQVLSQLVVQSFREQQPAPAEEPSNET